MLEIIHIKQRTVLVSSQSGTDHALDYDQHCFYRDQDVRSVGWLDNTILCVLYVDKADDRIHRPGGKRKGGRNWLEGKACESYTTQQTTKKSCANNDY